jgi:hypothetical protein
MINDLLLWCPDQLSAAWFLPIMRCGFPVYIASNECKPKRVCRPNVHTAWQSVSFGYAMAPSWPDCSNQQHSPLHADLEDVAVRARELKIPFTAVSSDLDIKGQLGPKEMCWIRVGWDPILMPALGRILMASGCLCCWDMKKACTKFYLVSHELASCWRDRLRLSKAIIQTNDIKNSQPSDCPIDNYYNGIIVHDSSIVTINSGKGFNISTNQDTYYLTTSYSRSFFESRRLANLVAEIEIEFARLGAVCVDKIYIPKQ